MSSYGIGIELDTDIHTARERVTAALEPVATEARTKLTAALDSLTVASGVVPARG